MKTFWIKTDKHFNALAEKSSCPYCDMGFPLTIKTMLPILILKKKYKQIIAEHRNRRRQK